MDLLSNAPLEAEVLSDPALVHTKWLELTPQVDSSEDVVSKYLQSNTAQLRSVAASAQATAISISIPLGWKQLAEFLTSTEWLQTHVRLDKTTKHTEEPTVSVASTMHIQQLAPSHLLSIEPLLIEQAKYHASLYPKYYRSASAIDWTTYRSELTDDFNHTDALNFVCLEKATPVGLLLAQVTTRNITVFDLIVSENYRGKGIGRALLAKLDEHTNDTSIPITLETWWDQPARTLYEKSGFVAVADSFFLALE